MEANRSHFIIALVTCLFLSHCIMTESMASPVKLRVCQGSSCLSKCRGSFSPLNSFEELRKNDDAPIEIEETYCMNQCKRGPNMRMIKDGNALIFEDSMNDTEMKRKAFQGVTTDEKVAHLFGIAKGATDGSNPGVESGPVEKLNDIMPS